MATIGHHYVHAAILGAVRKGIRLDTLLRHTGINPAQLNDHNSRINTLQMARLIKNIWRELGDEFMGFTPIPCRNGVFALMTEYARQATNLRGMLKRGIYFYNLFTPDIQMSLKTVQGKAQLTFQLASPDCDPEHFFTEFWLLIWHRFACWYIGESIHLYEAHFAYPKPNYLHELGLSFPCPLVFGQPRNLLTFDTLYLEKPLVKSRGDLIRFLRDSPLELMTLPGEDKSLAALLKKRLLSDGFLDIPNLETIADELSITPQTLNNRLKKEHTSYQQIKDEIRRDIAIDKLINDRLSVEKISAILGYKEARSFTRAFRKWTGFSPTNYRRII